MTTASSSEKPLGSQAEIDKEIAAIGEGFAALAGGAAARDPLSRVGTSRRQVVPALSVPGTRG